jgi:hypothetical protein
MSSITDIVRWKLDNLAEPQLSNTITDLRTLINNYTYKILQDKTDRLQLCIEMCAVITDLAPLVEVIDYHPNAISYKYGDVIIDVYKTKLEKFSMYINSVIVCEEVNSNSFNKLENFKLVVDYEYLQILAENINTPVEKILYLLYLILSIENTD